MERGQVSKPNWIFRIGAILLLLVLATTCLLSGLLARYRSGAQGGDSARVARFEIVESGDLYTKQFTLQMRPGETTGVEVDAIPGLQIVNKSEVTVRCSFKVETTGNLPLEFTWYDGNNAVETVDLAYNGGSTTLTLKAHWPDDNKGGTDSFLYHREIDHVIVTVTCDQID